MTWSFRTWSLRTWSIRARLAFYFAVLVGVILALYSVLLYATISYSVEKEFRRDLRHESRWLREVVLDRKKAGTLGSLSDDVHDLDAEVRITDADGHPVFDSGGADWTPFPIDAAMKEAVLNDAVWRRGNWNGSPRELLTEMFHIPGERPLYLQMLASRIDVISLRRTFSFWIFVLIPLAMALAVAAGRVYAKRSLAPIDTIRRRADGITVENLTARLPLPLQRDELFLLTETLNRLLARIEESFSKMKKFTADASHELRIPVTILKGTLDVTLRKNRSPEEYREAMEDAREEVGRLTQLVEDLLTLARAEAGQPTIARRRVALVPMLTDVLDAASALNADKVRLVLVPPPDRIVFCDPNLVRRLLLNLLQNAIKYTDIGGDVFLEARNESGRTIILVRDTGAGISSEDQEKIFDRFYRTDKARSREEGGVGLGLAIALAIAEAHRGTLTATSEKGKGSTFCFDLPDAATSDES